MRDKNKESHEDKASIDSAKLACLQFTKVDEIFGIVWLKIVNNFYKSSLELNTVTF